MCAVGPPVTRTSRTGRSVSLTLGLDFGSIGPALPSRDEEV